MLEICHSKCQSIFLILKIFYCTQEEKCNLHLHTPFSRQLYDAKVLHCHIKFIHFQPSTYVQNKNYIFGSLQSIINTYQAHFLGILIVEHELWSCKLFLFNLYDKIPFSFFSQLGIIQ